MAATTAAQTQPAAPDRDQKEASLATRATGTFEVRLTPQTGDSAGDAALGRMSISKQYHGDLEGTGSGQMLTAGTAVKASAGYVAMEQVRGVLQGRRGSFILQHSGTMTRGAAELSVTIVPDSGADQLAGISGAMTIVIADGKHSYVLEYALPPGQ